MRKLFIFFVILLFSLFFLNPIVLAQEIDYFSVNTEISNDGKSQISISVTLSFPNEEQITIHTFSKIRNLNTEASFKDFNCQIKERAYGSDIACDISQITKNSKSFKVIYETNDLVSRADRNFLFKQEITVPQPTKNFLAKVFLPEAMALPKTEQTYIPNDGEKASDGRRIYIYWKRGNMKADDAFNINITYEPFSFDLPLEIIVLIIVIIIFFTIFYFVKKQKFGMRFVLPVLKSDEKKVMESVLKNGDGISQKIVVRESGYSKAKVSKVLKNLQERNIIKLERVGRSNKIYLIKEIEKEDKK